ncbi:hypothetical protein QJS10_CPB18g01553 [Acorus calamus]|uniref:KIB1-4 beta-propeller domain-containing protein n=1 Tax=Acorus calamus TaxID=4465 RepID=A0AAV9CNH5_ACOCL|nr:hypothetical protein QJS10_CPB18g01553 [Acorus calamus]
MAPPADWSELPNELPYLIESRLTKLSDRVRFPAVCNPWRSALEETDNLPNNISSSTIHREFPWLMLPGCALYSPLENKLLLRPINLPLNHRFQRFIGSSSSDGWVAMADDLLNITLFNPISGAQSPLPSLRRALVPSIRHLWFPNVLPWLKKDDHPQKAVWSPDPTNSGSVSMVILMSNNKLAFYRPGEARWNFIRANFFDDVIHYKGVFYLVDFCGRLFTLDINLSSLQQHLMMEPMMLWLMEPKKGIRKPYLVEGPNRSLLMVIREMEFPGDSLYRTTMGFKVFELDEGTMSWKGKRDGLGDDGMVFLGMNASTYLSATDFHGCKGNRIYFTDDNNVVMSRCLKYGGCDMGVFCLEDGSLGPHYQTDVKLMWPHPIWIFRKGGSASVVRRCAISKRLFDLLFNHLPDNFYLLDVGGWVLSNTRLLLLLCLYNCTCIILAFLLCILKWWWMR